MIRYLEDGEREKIRPLYEKTFEDSQAFTDYYFADYVTGQTRCLVEERDGQVISMISIHEKHWMLHEAQADRRVSVWYLYGIATEQAYRSQGCMRRLLSRVLMDAGREQVAYVYLIPVNPKVYEALGFHLVDAGEIMDGISPLPLSVCRPNGALQACDIGQETENVQYGQDSEDVQHGRDSEDVRHGRDSGDVQYGQGFWQPAAVQDYAGLAFFYRDGCVRAAYDAWLDKTETDLRRQAEMAQLEGGDLYVYYEGAKLSAFATAIVDQDTCVIVEYVDWQEMELRQGSDTMHRLAGLAALLGCRKYEYRRLPVMVYGEQALQLHRLGAMDEV